jgi:hypothetical protein
MDTKVSGELSAMEGQTFIVGREGHIYIGNTSVSRQHAEIEIINGRIHLRDLGSSNGIYYLIENKPVRFQEAYVEPRQSILIGDQRCTAQGLLAAVGIIADHLGVPA